MNIHKCFKAHKYYSRLDHFLKENLADVSRTQIVKWIKEERVKLDGVVVNKKNHEVMDGQAVEMELPQEVEEEYVPTFELDVLYEDEYIMVINKPCGISVHVGAGVKQETILDVFMHHYPQIKEMPDQERPGIVHRLDKDTSGVMILAKDIRSMRRLQKQFKRRDVQKTYLAFATGQMRYRVGTIDKPIVRSPKNRTRYMVTEWDSELADSAREAQTDYEVLKQYEGFSYVRLQPHTGRTHQLRVHLAHSRNNILGDRIYGKEETFERLALHAFRIEFIHPITDEPMAVRAPVPRVFLDYLKEKRDLMR